MPGATLEDLLLRAGYVDKWQLQSAMEYWRSGWGGRIEDVLLKLGFISDSDRAAIARLADASHVAH